MKFLALVFFLSLPNLVLAQISVEHDLSFDRKTWIRYDYSSGGFLGIGRSRKVFDQTTTWRAPLKHKLEGDGSSSIVVGTVGSSSDAAMFEFQGTCVYPEALKNLECIFHPLFNRSLADMSEMSKTPYVGSFFSQIVNSVATNRTSQVDTQIDGQKVNISVSDYLFSDRSGLRFMKFHSDAISGFTRINLPLDNKFISFQKKHKLTGIFNPQLSLKGLVQYEGSNFKSSLDINTREQWETVWTLPGQNNFIEIKVGGIDTEVGLGLGIKNDQWQNIGELSVEVSSISEQIKGEASNLLNLRTFDAAILDRIFTNIENMSQLKNLSDDEIIQARDFLLALVTSDTYKNATYASHSLNQISDLLKNLSLVGLNNYTEPQNPSDFTYMGWDIKAAAYVLAVDIAKDSIVKLDQFCSQVDFTTATGEVKKISGLNLASFYVGRAVSRLSNFRFNEFSYLFEYMNILKAEGRTFADVRNNEDQIKQIRAVVELLKDANILKKSPFGVAHDELSQVLKSFGDLNGNGMNLSDLLSTLSQIEVEVEDLRKTIMLRLRTFQSDNTNIVDFSDLETRVALVSEDLNTLSNSIDTVFGINATTFNENGVTEDSRKQFINFLVDITTNYLSVFENTAGDLSIDRFLIEYKKVHNIDKLTEKFKSCLPI